MPSLYVGPSSGTVLPWAIMSFSEELLWDHINDGWSSMSFKQRNLWNAIKRMPEEWEIRENYRVWVVALMGETAIYYDHIEEEFALAQWSQFGIIGNCKSSSWTLPQAVQMLMNTIGTGY